MLLENFFRLKLHKGRDNCQGYLEFKWVFFKIKVIIQNAAANLKQRHTAFVSKCYSALCEMLAVAIECLLGLLSTKEFTVNEIRVLLSELVDFYVSVQSQCKEW